MNAELLTNSRMRTGRLCLRKHEIEYNMGYRPVIEPEAFRFGTLIHKALEIYWLKGAVEALLFLRDADVASEFERAKAVAMIMGYDQRWKHEQDQYEVIAVEKEFQFPLVHPDTGETFPGWVLAGKIDAIARHKQTGSVLVVEHKTASLAQHGGILPGSDYWRKLTMDGQISVYLIALRLMGFKGANASLYDVLGKPQHKPHKATPVDARKYKKDGSLYANQRNLDETPSEYGARIIESMVANNSEYFQRGEVVRLEADIDKAMRDIWEMAEVLSHAKANSLVPRNPEACSQYGQLCAFFDVCEGTDTLSNTARFKRLANVHAELEIANAK